jgi:hypothetical protein
MKIQSLVSRLLFALLIAAPVKLKKPESLAGLPFHNEPLPLPKKPLKP